MSKVKIDKTTIRAVARLIAERFDPEQIILFGSHARGNAGSRHRPARPNPCQSAAIPSAEL